MPQGRSDRDKPCPYNVVRRVVFASLKAYPVGKPFRA